MPRCDGEQAKRWSCRNLAIELPVTQGEDADAKGLSKLRLSHGKEATQGANIGATLDLSLDQAPSKFRGDSAAQLSERQGGGLIRIAHFGRTGIS